MRELIAIHQPCILCEEPLMASVLHRDDETGEEVWSHESIPHECAPMKALRQERTTSNYAQKGPTGPERHL